MMNNLLPNGYFGNGMPIFQSLVFHLRYLTQKALEVQAVCSVEPVQINLVNHAGISST